MGEMLTDVAADRELKAPHRAMWALGDYASVAAEALPFDDAEFDAVISCVGVMFAPHHQAAADELLRVLRPDGTLALVSWTPQGFVGELFGTMRPFKHRYGPTVAAYRGLADDAQKVADLDEGGGTMGWEYLLLTARRA